MNLMFNLFENDNLSPVYNLWNTMPLAKTDKFKLFKMKMKKKIMYEDQEKGLFGIHILNWQIFLLWLLRKTGFTNKHIWPSWSTNSNCSCYSQRQTAVLPIIADHQRKGIVNQLCKVLWSYFTDSLKANDEGNSFSDNVDDFVDDITVMNYNYNVNKTICKKKKYIINL